MRYIPVIAISIILAACVSPRARIADALTGFGLDTRRAQCVGADLERNLSTGQLLELGRVARAYKSGDPDPARLTLADLLRASSQINDPAVPLGVARAAGRCGVTPLGFAPADPAVRAF